ncbi:MAG TPA: mannonate dehydratase [Anaerolineaceae bacterium]
MPSQKSAIQFSMFIQPDPKEEELLFARQLGMQCVYTWLKDHQRTTEYLIGLRQRVERHGLRLYNAGNMTVAKSDKIHLALPGRDEIIADFQAFIRSLGKAGIHTTTFTWEPDQVWSSEPGETRGARTRRVDLAEMMERPLTHGREYTREELWENFAYFIQKMLPVCEESGVRLALHPNDPPTLALGGIPCLIHSFEDYERAYALANHSPYLGMEFCVGCWLEGGEGFGDLFKAIRYYVERKKIFITHFRNVSAPLPNFIETFLDNGYMDMYQVMKVFVEAGYDGTMILDHSPHLAGDPARVGTAYAIGYMRALLERAEAEMANRKENT